MLLFGGLIPYLLYDSSRRDKVECERCGFVFSPVKRLTASDYVFAFFVLAVIIVIVVYLVATLRA